MDTPPSDNSIKTVLELDLASYSDISRVLEENLDVYAVKAFQDQIQSFVDRGLEQVGLKREDIVLGTAGDNALLVFDEPTLMHRFAQAMQEAVAIHNRDKTVESAKRCFRMGAATGPVLLLQAERRIVGTTVARAVRLEAAAAIGQILVDSATYDALPNSVKKLYGQEETIAGKREERFPGRRCALAPIGPPLSPDASQESSYPESNSGRPSSAGSTCTSRKRRQTRSKITTKGKDVAAQEPSQLGNPYEFSSVATKQTFKGRNEELGELLDSIRTGTHTAIFGLQRMGKTSLIEEGLKDELGNAPKLAKEALLARIDLQRLGGDQVKYRDLLHTIIEAITEKLAAAGVVRGLQDLRALTYELFSASRFQRGDRTQFFSTFAKLLRGFASAAHRRIVLIIDEFSEVRRVIERNKVALQHNQLRNANLLPYDLYLDVPFIHHLGSLLKDQELRAKFTLIVVVRPFMAEFDEREELQLLKLMKPIMLYHLDEAAAKALITEPLEGTVHFEDGAPDYLYRLTAGHPYLLQFLLKMLVDKINREKRRRVSLEDILMAETRMASEGPAYDAQFEVLISDYSMAEVMHSKESLSAAASLFGLICPNP